MRPIRPASLTLALGTVALLAAIAPAPAPAETVFRAGPPIKAGYAGEVVHISPDGQRLLSTSVDQGLSVLDISDLSHVTRLATFDLLGEEDELDPNSAAFTPDGKFIIGAFVGTGGSEPDRGWLVVLRRDGDELTEVPRMQLPGQPDSIEVSADGEYAAVAIEDEGEDVPGGVVMIVHLVDEVQPATWALHEVPIVLGPEYPDNEEAQPEYVDFNADNEVAVSIQEQNAIGILDAEAAADGDPETDPVVRIFSAGTTSFDDDLEDDGIFDFEPVPPTLTEEAREPDAVAWTADGQAIAAVAEGENSDPHEWMVYDREGNLLFSSGTELHRNAALFGLHSDRSSSQPEGLTIETFEGTEYAFLVTERTANLSIYDVDDPASPQFVGTFPTGVRPETIAFDLCAGSPSPATRPTTRSRARP